MQTTHAGRTAIVTGGAQGIGRAIASTLADAGANVVIADLRDSGADTASAIKAAGGECRFVQADISRSDGIATVVADALGRYGSIDILCPNAAVFNRSLVVDMNEADWDAVVDGGLKSVFLIVKACLPHMVRQRRGRIVVTGSITGAKVGQTHNAHYGAAKAGIVGFARCVALEVAQHNITINVVEPGNIMTEAMMTVPELHQSFIDHIPLNRMGSVQEVAAVTSFLASDAASYITGQSVVVDGGQILPENLPLLRGSAS
jgi:3-oxoacyl-[acyl-carrier protein] reductase